MKSKLVRDRIPELAAERGASVRFRKAAGKREMQNLLRLKLFEEASEVEGAHLLGPREVLEELADVVEVCLATAREHGFTESDLEAARLSKRVDKGGFTEGWIMEPLPPARREDDPT